MAQITISELLKAKASWTRHGEHKSFAQHTADAENLILDAAIRIATQNGGFIASDELRKLRGLN